MKKLRLAILTNCVSHSFTSTILFAGLVALSLAIRMDAAAVVAVPYKTSSPTAAATDADFLWALVWADEFSGAANTGINTNEWLYDTGAGYGCRGCPFNWGTGEVESMTSSTANVYQDG